MNYCQIPEEGELLYRCGWELGRSPIGNCRFALPCPVFVSRCIFRADGYCTSSRAQEDAEERRLNEDTIKN
jgi:hypothetical protein